MPRNPSGFTPAQRAYLRKVIRAEREILRDEITLALNDALRAEAQAIMLQHMTRDFEVPPRA
jgi:DNA-binding protein YbaB